MLENVLTSDDKVFAQVSSRHSGYTPFGQKTFCRQTFGRLIYKKFVLLVVGSSNFVAQMSVAQMSVSQMSVGQMSVAQMSVSQMSVSEMSVGQMSVSQMSVGQTSVGQMSVGQMPVGQMVFD